jgi:myo-inositol-1-phosphate synthase
MNVEQVTPPAAALSTASGLHRRKATAEAVCKRGLPDIGDDIKSQGGATITHRVLTPLFTVTAAFARAHYSSLRGNTDL